MFIASKWHYQLDIYVRISCAHHLLILCAFYYSWLMTKILSSVFHSGSPADLSSNFALPALSLGLAVDVFSLRLTLNILKLGPFDRSQKLIKGLFPMWLVFHYAQFLTDSMLVPWDRDSLLPISSVGNLLVLSRTSSCQGNSSCYAPNRILRDCQRNFMLS